MLVGVFLVLFVWSITRKRPQPPQLIAVPDPPVVEYPSAVKYKGVASSDGTYPDTADPVMQKIVQVAAHSDGPVLGSVDENGELTIREMKANDGT